MSEFFADDTRISKQISCVNDCELLQNDLNSVIQWSTRNNMELHQQKFELLNHRYQSNNTLCQLPFGCQLLTYKISDGDTLHPVHSAKDLGIIITSDLSWSVHIGNLVSRARSLTSWVLSVFKSRDRDVLMTLYKSLIRSILEFSCPLWNPSKIGDIQLLEGVQRTITSKITGCKESNYWDRLKILNLMSLQRRRERYIILYMWKILHGVSPNDLGIVFRNSSRNGLVAVVPSLKRGSSVRNQSLYDSSFAVMGPRLWNIIPANIKTLDNFLAFKERVSQFSMNFPDQPPISGYTCSNSNSLIEWNSCSRRLIV